MVLVVAFFQPTAALANDLSGFWKIDNQPAWVEVQMQEGSAIGVVRRHDENANAVGRTLLKNVSLEEGGSGKWRGQIFAARLGEFRDADITLLDPSRMQIEVKVGFMSRTVIWQRVAEVPR